MDSVDLRVKQILLDGFVKARLPRLTRDVCDRCAGEGQVYDPQVLSEIVCPSCDGSGEVEV